MSPSDSDPTPAPASRPSVRDELHDLARDLHAWLEWAALTGADAAPSDPTVPAGPLPAPESLPPLAQRPRPATAPQRPVMAATAPIATAPFASSPPPAPPPAPRPPRPPIAPIAAPPRDGATESLATVHTSLGDCRRCRLHEGRKHIVFGIGDPSAPLVLVGEAPGQQEDLTGEPFVGRSGQLLNRMLACIGLTRSEVYICNVIKCRPPQNRDPLLDEIATCSPFLHRQLNAIAPRVIMTLGRFAGTNVTGTDTSLGELRKSNWSWQGIPVVASYHPSYLLRTPKMKRAAWEDFLAVRTLLRGEPG